MSARRIAGLFALMALTSSFAEAVWASTCAPGMDMGGDVPAPMAMGAPASTPMDMGREARSDAGAPSTPSHEPGGEQPECPLAPAVTPQGCLGAASLPARAVQALVVPSERMVVILGEGGSHNPLLESAPFHPPRA